MTAEAREWIIQKCNNAFKNNYENWPGYSEKLLTKEEMLKALEECTAKWPTLDFRGHNVVNQPSAKTQEVLRKADNKLNLEKISLEQLSKDWDETTH